MNAVEAIAEPAQKPASDIRQHLIQMPLGLMGFERIKHYVLVADPDEQPLMRLQMLDAPNNTFLVTEPGDVLADYRPDIAESDTEFLGLEDPEDAMVLNIVTLRSNGQATVNLKGPLVINRRTWVGKQVVPTNAAALAVQHRLETCE